MSVNSGRACTRCGAPSREASRFCSECGSRLAPASHSAEYKQVTVLFADVVRSMDLAATLDIERLRELLTEVVERSAAVARRYAGTVEFNGDGVMAIFGAPTALEDHAFRACAAALAIQDEMALLAAEVTRRDGVGLQMRVGLNSGRVIAGDLGSGSLGYAATGQHVGLAQRMESVAPPGGVLLSESTAHLVEGTVVMSEPEWVTVKGAADAVAARRLLALGSRRAPVGRTEASLVGRRAEMTVLSQMVDRALGGLGGVVSVVGPPGIGKSRAARETAALAAARGFEVCWTFGESHAGDIPFRVVAELLRVRTGVASLDGEAARARVREQVPNADPQDLLLFDDLLGIADPDIPPPQIDPDARRRRLTSLINTASLARSEPVLFVIEDAQWIDAVSESMLANFLTIVPQTPSLVLVTCRPEYHGVLAHAERAQTIMLAPLDDSDTAALIGELLRSDASIRDVSRIIADRAAGNPFFAEEMVRELAQRGILEGHRGAYRCQSDTAEVCVPATVEAAIAARIDHLDARAKRTVQAASVIGARFGADLLAALGIDAELDEALGAELVDQIRFTRTPEYTFSHPLMRAVAYESQLKSGRSELHRRVAAAIESRDPAAAEQNAALIAEHLEAAGDGHAAYGWHMRAAAWVTNRDIAAAHSSWLRAQSIADGLPADDPCTAAMQIAPRTMLCGIAWRVHMTVAGERFDELRRLCSAAGDKASLAIAMAGLVMEHAFQDRVSEASRVASEAWALAEAIGDPNLIVGLSFPPIYAKADIGAWGDVLAWSERVIELADGDASMGGFVFGSPLAVALVTRAGARYHLNHAGWSDDLRHGVSMARSTDPMSFATTVTWAYNPAITLGARRPDDLAVSEIEDASRAAERSADDMALIVAQVTLGIALVYRSSDADRARGRKLLEEASEEFPRRGHFLSDLPMIDICLARETFRRGDRDEGIARMRVGVDHLLREGNLTVWGPAVIGILVEALVERGGEHDYADAETAVEWLATMQYDGPAVRDVWLLRLRALLARARGDAAGHRVLASRYRAMAEAVGLEAHIAWATDMVRGCR